jgi:hypothetical protein
MTFNRQKSDSVDFFITKKVRNYLNRCIYLCGKWTRVEKLLTCCYFVEDGVLEAKFQVGLAQDGAGEPGAECGSSGETRLRPEQDFCPGPAWVNQTRGEARWKHGLADLAGVFSGASQGNQTPAIALFRQPDPEATNQSDIAAVLFREINGGLFPAENSIGTVRSYSRRRGTNKG